MLRTFSLLLALLIGGCAAIEPTLTELRTLLDPRAKEPPTKLDLLVEQFSATAFDSQYGPRRNAFRRIDADVVIRVSEPNFGQRAKIEATAAELAKLTNRAITVLGPKDLDTPANVIVVFNGDNICRVATKGPRDPMFVQIGASRCITQELYQALAMDNEACVVDSILCENASVAAYTEADKILIRVAYDTSLRRGMNRKQALPIVRELIAGLLPGEDKPAPSDSE